MRSKLKARVIGNNNYKTLPMSDFAIYVSTCDKYSDCWSPFCVLFQKYWPDFDGTVYLSSEYKKFETSINNFVPLCVCSSNNIPTQKRLTWGKLTRLALGSIPEDIILFMQEDFFLKGYVRTKEIKQFADLMRNNEQIKCIHLTDQCGKGAHPSEYPHLDEMELHRPYRISCQCALWRKTELLSLLRDRENAWEWEMYGSTRSASLGHSYFQVSHDYVKLGHFEIIPYVFTGIIKGQWLEEVQSLFEDNGINIDFQLRGFYHPGNQEPKNQVHLLSTIKILFWRVFNKVDALIQKWLKADD